MPRAFQTYKAESKNSTPSPPSLPPPRLGSYLLGLRAHVIKRPQATVHCDDHDEYDDQHPPVAPPRGRARVRAYDGQLVVADGRLRLVDDACVRRVGGAHEVKDHLPPRPDPPALVPARVGDLKAGVWVERVGERPRRHGRQPAQHVARAGKAVDLDNHRRGHVAVAGLIWTTIVAGRDVHLAADVGVVSGSLVGGREEHAGRTCEGAVRSEEVRSEAERATDGVRKRGIAKRSEQGNG